MIAPNRDRVIAVFLFVVLGGLAYSSAAGITGSNDGASYALTRALADEGRTIIDTFHDFTEGIDYAERDGHYYSDRAPGVSFLAVPFSRLGEWLGARPSEPYSKHDDGAPQVPFVLMVPAFSAGAVAALVDLIARRLRAHA